MAKVVTFNVNGLRAVLRRTSSSSLLQFLESFDADIIALQETKLAKNELERHLALADGWDSYFACCPNRQYSGVATFVRSVRSTPVWAEEGFTGTLCKAGATPPPGWQEGIEAVQERYTPAELQEMDSEGRVVMTDHGAFILVNVYGPAISSEERLEDRFAFKLQLYQALTLRLHAFLHAGRRVLVVGDLNIAPFVVDRAEGDALGLLRRDRAWLHSMLRARDGPFVDAYRELHPNRVDAFTCWSVASGAKTNNWGSRIDLILVAGPALPGAPSQQPTIDERTHKDEHAPQPGMDPPRHKAHKPLTHAAMLRAAREGDARLTLTEEEVQRLPPPQCWQPTPLDDPRHGFFRTAVTACDILHAVEGSDHVPVMVALEVAAEHMPVGLAPVPGSSRLVFTGTQRSIKAWATVGSQQSHSQLQPIAQAPTAAPRGPARCKQATLLTFFQPPSSAPPAPEQDPAPAISDVVPSEAQQAAQPACIDHKARNAEAVAAWQELAAKMQPPKCSGHQEPCVLRTVKKAGENKDGPFPGPGRCPFFLWTGKYKGQREEPGRRGSSKRMRA